jgi:plasmid stability protein
LTTLTIPDVDDTLKLRLKARALLHGKSMEAETRDILMEALGKANSEPPPSNLYALFEISSSRLAASIWKSPRCGRNCCLRT